MTIPTLERLLEAPWEPVIEADPEGGFRLRLPPLRDFTLYAESEDELRQENWKEALRSHLQGYLNCGKTPPYPGRMRVLEQGATTGADAGANNVSSYSGELTAA